MEGGWVGGGGGLVVRGGKVGVGREIVEREEGGVGVEMGS